MDTIFVLFAKMAFSEVLECVNHINIHISKFTTRRKSGNIRHTENLFSSDTLQSIKRQTVT